MLKSRLVVLMCLVVLISSFSACNFQEKGRNESNPEKNKTEGSFETVQEGFTKTETTENATIEPIQPENTETPALESEAPIVTEKLPELQIDPPAEMPETPTPLAWKEAYLATLETMKVCHVAYALVYIDNDDIPELYLNGDCSATGDGVYSYKNGTVVEQRLSRTWGGKYIEKGGELCNDNGHMGYYTTDVYKLTADGFFQTFSALTTEEVIGWDNEDPILSYNFFVEDARVSETEYNNALDAAFNYAVSKSFHENAVNYDQIVEQIKAHK